MTLRITKPGIYLALELAVLAGVLSVGCDTREGGIEFRETPGARTSYWIDGEEVDRERFVAVFEKIYLVPGTWGDINSAYSRTKRGPSRHKVREYVEGRHRYTQAQYEYDRIGIAAAPDGSDPAIVEHHITQRGLGALAYALFGVVGAALVGVIICVIRCRRRAA